MSVSEALPTPDENPEADILFGSCADILQLLHRKRPPGRLVLDLISPLVIIGLTNPLTTVICFRSSAPELNISMTLEAYVTLSSAFTICFVHYSSLQEKAHCKLPILTDTT